MLSRALFSARVVDPHLGTGSQSSVALVELPCLDCDSGSEPLLAARKTLLEGNSREALLREATALRAAAAASPFVCRCLGWAELPGGKLALLTEYADGGSLQDELDALVQIRRQQALDAEAAWQLARVARASAAVEAALALRGSLLLPPTPLRPAAAAAAAAAAPSVQPPPQTLMQPEPQVQPEPQAHLPAACNSNHNHDSNSGADGIFKSINDSIKSLEHRRSGSTCSCPLPVARHGFAASSCGAAGAVRCLSAPPPSPSTPEPAAASPQASWRLAERGEVTSARRFLAYPDMEACSSPAALAAALAAPSLTTHLPQQPGAAARLPLTILRLLPQAHAGPGADADADLDASPRSSGSCCSVQPEPGPGAEGGDGGGGGELCMQMMLCGGASSFFSATSSSVRTEELETGEEGEGEQAMGGTGLGPTGMDLDLDLELEDCADSSCGGGGGGGRACAAEESVEEQMGDGHHVEQARGGGMQLARCASFSSGVSAGDSAWASAGGEFGAAAVPPPALPAQVAGTTISAAAQPAVASAAAASAPAPQEHRQQAQPTHALASTKPAAQVAAATAAAPTAAPTAATAATPAAAPAMSPAVLPPRMPPSEMLMAETRLRVVTASLLHALHGLHVQGFVHLHITPANVLCSGIGRVLLADFGTARCLIPAPHAHTDGLPCYHHLCPAPPPCPTGLLLAAASAGARAAAASAAAAAAADAGGRGRATSAAVVLERLRSWAAVAGDAAVRHHVASRSRASAAAGAGASDGGAAAVAGPGGRPSSSASVSAAEAALMVFTAPELRSAAVGAAASAATAAALSTANPPHAELAAAVHAAVAAAVAAAASPAADMYSLGALLIACAAWHGDVGRMRAYQRYETDMPGWVPAGLRRLVEGLLDERPGGRPSAAAALCDPYLAGLSMADLLI
ncbi:hypothetical protein HXX76_002560 [Chlamydomonas incerta]|uniref:Protein kinase domain-containing protein n=1 Tax=Chlamydomonas incerta TaxID=51695 RepID=A0A835TKZ7_CHLIN|nr:hypothetical protein HXX76_002560 [Chlamydomonas incerta]|eukprot:KAG2442474.1 hypothetical protein HXX76_002560 [Chlamydomonas incerta]